MCILLLPSSHSMYLQLYTDYSIEVFLKAINKFNSLNKHEFILFFNFQNHIKETNFRIDSIHSIQS